MALEDKEKILHDLDQLPEPDERLAYIIALGRLSPELPDVKKLEQYKIEGCLSQLWLVPELRDQHVYFQVDSDAIITKGIGCLLATCYSGMMPQDILKNPPTFLAEYGIDQHLSVNRRNGLANLCRQINLYAAAYESLGKIDGSGRVKES